MVTIWGYVKIPLKKYCISLGVTPVDVDAMSFVRDILHIEVVEKARATEAGNRMESGYSTRHV